MSDDQAAFSIEDRWKLSGAVLSLSRKVNVMGPENGAWFLSAIRLSTAPTAAWTDADYLVPGLLSGEPHPRDSAPGGASNLCALVLSSLSNRKLDLTDRKPDQQGKLG